MAKRRKVAVYRPQKTKPKKTSFSPLPKKQGTWLTPQAAQWAQGQGQQLQTNVLGWPKGATAAPPKPRPAAPPKPLPFNPNMDAGYQSAIAGANRDYDLQIGDLGYQEQRIKQDYGFDDPSNPYSRAKLLERAYQQGQSRTTNSMASQGQLYSGATQRGLEYGTTLNNQAVDEARRSYGDQLHGITSGRTAALNTQKSAYGTAYGDALSRSLSTPPEDPAQGTGGGGPAPSQRQQLQAFGAQGIKGIGGGKWQVTYKGKKRVVAIVGNKWKFIK